MKGFEQSVLLKKKELIEHAEKLPQIKINWVEPIQIRCSDIGNEIDFKVNNELPAIYCFKIISPNDRDAIRSALSDYKDVITTERACPKIEKKRSTNTQYLYCGSVKKNLNERLKQHLGNSSKGTYALQLKHWAGGLDLELEFQYALLTKDDKVYTELLESALAKCVKPLVGKMA